MLPYYSYPFVSSRDMNKHPISPTTNSNQLVSPAGINQSSGPMTKNNIPNNTNEELLSDENQMGLTDYSNIPNNQYPLESQNLSTNANPYMTPAINPYAQMNIQNMPCYDNSIMPPCYPVGSYGFPYGNMVMAQNMNNGYEETGELDEEKNNIYIKNFTNADRQPPILSDNPVKTNIVLFKELTGYKNYGNPSNDADILYTGNRGTWTFDVQPFLLVPGNMRAQIVIRGVLDDKYDVPENRYSVTITINGRTVHRGRVSLVHGRPFGKMFNNWRELVFDVPNIRRNNRIIIENTSNTSSNNWIGFDWMELRLVPRTY